MKLSEYDQFKQDHPELERVITSSGIVYEAGNTLKVADGFKEVISKAESRLGKKINRSDKW